MVEIDDQAALDAYTRILDVIANRCGSDCAGLFAEPVISRSNGAASGRVDWYTRYEGTAKPFSELDQGTFNAVQRTLETRLAALRPLLFDEQFGPFISAAFNLASPESLLAVGGEPVILDWGLLPLALGVDRFSRERHFSAIMGPLAGRLPLPVLSRAEWVANQAPASPATGQSSAANMMQDQRPIPGVGVVSPSPRAPVTVVTAGNSARAAAIATGLALLAVGATYIPGLLSYTADAATAKALETNQGILDQLEARRKALEAALAEDCANPETRQKTQGLLPQDPTRLRVGSAPPTTSPTPSPAIPPVTVPGAPTAPGQTPAPVPQQAVPPPPTGPEGAPSTLAERIERGVAFVIASKDDDGNASTGSGFFVRPDTIVTNRHVIEGGKDFYVVNRHIGLVKAELIGTAGRGTTNDLAILKVPPQPAAMPFPLAQSRLPLQQVIAAGFPGVTMATDPVFRSIMRGDASAAARLTPVMTTGTVNHVQAQDNAASSFIVHNAFIAPGNSGGPLIDQCGRVMGVNTFGRTDSKMPVTANYALGSDGLKTYLERESVSVSSIDTPCSPNVIQPPAPTPVPAPAPAPVTARPPVTGGPPAPTVTPAQR